MSAETLSGRQAARDIQHPAGRWHAHFERQEELVGTTQQGIILLGDISGYTSLLTETELTHARFILQQVFDAIFAATGEHFLVNEIEGDAIFSYCVHPQNPERLLEVTLQQIRNYGRAFHQARENLIAMRAAQAREGKACSCGACSTVNQLSFKFIIHYGEFGVNQIGPFVKLVGGSVIVAHRLLKNSVPGHEYILMTRQALQYIPEKERQEFVMITEALPHFGDLQIGYRLLEWAREE